MDNSTEVLPSHTEGVERDNRGGIFNREAERQLKEKSLGFWDKARPLDIFTLSNAILRINTQSLHSDFGTGVGYLQDEIKLVLSSKGFNRVEKHLQLTKFLSSHDVALNMAVLERVMTPFTEGGLNINHLAFKMAREICDPGEPNTKQPEEIVVRGANFQRILTYSFLLLDPKQLSDYTSLLLVATELFAKLLTKRNVDPREVSSRAYGVFLGAASSAIAALQAREFLGKSAREISPAPDFVDIFYGIDCFVWDGNQIVGFVQSTNHSLGGPSREFILSSKDADKPCNPKVSIFDNGKVFYSLLLPLEVGSGSGLRLKTQTKQGKRRSLEEIEVGKMGKFLKGVDVFSEQNTYIGDSFYFIDDFKTVRDQIKTGQYSVINFVGDISEHIQVLKSSRVRVAEPAA